MFFTREDILKIQNALLQLSVKDSELPSAEPVTYDDTLSIVQDGKNKQIKIEDFFNQISLWKREDFINITDKYDEHYISLIEAIKLVPILQRKDGLVITFQDIEGNWEIYQFRGNITEFFNVEKWFNLYDYRNNIIQSVVPDEEDLTVSTPDENGNSLVSLKDRVYDPTSFNGKGYKILRKNIQSVNIAVTKIKVEFSPSSDGILSFSINGKETQVLVSVSTDNTTTLVADKIASKLTETMTEYEVSKDVSTITLIRKFGGSVTPSLFSASTTGVVCTVTDSSKRESRNIITKDMINKPNTIYEIRYDFDLNGETINVPENCILKFEEGTLTNGKINNCANDYVKPEWFGAKGDGISDDTKAIQLCLDISKLILLDKKYLVTSNLYITRDNITIDGQGIIITDNKANIYCYNSDHITIKNISITSKIGVSGIVVYISNSLQEIVLKKPMNKTEYTSYNFTNLKIDNYSNGYSPKKQGHSICITSWDNAKISNIRIENCTIKSSGFFEQTENETGGTDCIYVAGYKNLIYDVVISNNSLLYAGRNAISIASSSNIPAENISIDHNYIANARCSGCDLEYATNVMINSCHFYSCGLTESNGGNIMRCGIATQGNQDKYKNIITNCVFKECRLAIGGFFISASNCIFINSPIGSYETAQAKVNITDSIIYCDKTCVTHAISVSGYGCIKNSDIRISNNDNIAINTYSAKNDVFVFENNKIVIEHKGDDDNAVGFNINNNSITKFLHNTIIATGYKSLIYTVRDLLLLDGNEINTDSILIQHDYNVSNITFNMGILNNVINCSALIYGLSIGSNKKIVLNINNNELNLSKCSILADLKEFNVENNHIVLSKMFNSQDNISGVFYYYPQKFVSNINISNNYIENLNDGLNFLNIKSGASTSKLYFNITNNIFQTTNANITFNDVFPNTRGNNTKEKFNNIVINNTVKGLVLLSKEGNSSNRPYNVEIGFVYKDTTINKLILWEGTKWINLDGTELA